MTAREAPRTASAQFFAFSMPEGNFEMSHPATPAATSEIGDSINDVKDLGDAT